MMQIMDKKISYTKAEARKLMGAKTDSDLARKLGTVRQAVSAWGGDDDPIPQQRVWQIRAMLAEQRDTAA